MLSKLLNLNKEDIKELFKKERKKYKETNMKKFGYDNPSKNPEIKIIKNKAKYEMMDQENIKLGCNIHCVPAIGKNETKLLNELERKDNICIIRQYPICEYVVDGYCKETNTVYEIDELFHSKQKAEDKIRQQRITDELNCKFIRIPDLTH